MHLIYLSASQIVVNRMRDLILCLIENLVCSVEAQNLEELQHLSLIKATH